MKSSSGDAPRGEPSIAIASDSIVPKSERDGPGEALPFQVVDRVSFGHSELANNRLIRGDNLQVMRQLDGHSIDLIYIDPPFFSGRHYDASVGDRGGRGSFSDLWEGGMAGYLGWLNPRLYEMKRLLKTTGGLVVHCDWHASHYIKIELDKLFGYDRLQNEIIWSYRSGGGSRRRYGRKHDTLLWYSRSLDGHTFNVEAVRVPYDAVIAASRWAQFNDRGKVLGSVWDISRPANHSGEWTGYPTQKPKALLERIVAAHSNIGDVVADFFAGSGTTAVVAQDLNRRWIACDESPVAVTITRDRLARQGGERTQERFPIPDFTIEHLGP